MTTNQPPTCQLCGQPGHNALAHQQPQQQAPMYPQAPMVAPRRRSAMGTTLAILFAIFVVFPLLLVGGCAMLGLTGIGMMGQ
jgi:hypothetical protein